MRNIQIARKKLDHVIEKVDNREVSMITLCRYLNKEFRSMSIKFRSKKGDWFSVSGNFGGEIDRDEDLRYNVDITYDRQEKYFIPTKSFFQDIFVVLVHEFRHSYQERKRKKVIQPWCKHPKFVHPNKKIMDEVNYLSDYDELDAYAYELAYVFKLNKKKNILSSWIVRRYRKSLGKYAPKLYNKFLTKIYKYAQINK